MAQAHAEIYQEDYPFRIISDVNPTFEPDLASLSYIRRCFRGGYVPFVMTTDAWKIQQFRNCHHIVFGFEGCILSQDKGQTDLQSDH